MTLIHLRCLELEVLSKTLLQMPLCSYNGLPRARISFVERQISFRSICLCDGSSHVVNVGGLYPVLLLALIDDQKRSVSGTLLRLSQIR